MISAERKIKSLFPFSYDDNDTSRIAVKHRRLLSALKYNPETGVFTSNETNGIRVRGCIDESGYISIWFAGTRYRAHRLAWFYMTGKMPKDNIDHINGNKSDNRYSNLREADHKQNAHNARLSINNTSGARCVNFSKSDGKWVAGTNRFGKYHNLGRFSDKKQAIKAVNRFLKKTDGEFFSEVEAKRSLVSDNIKTLYQIKKKLQLGETKKLDSYQTYFINRMLRGWGVWAYSGLDNKRKVNPIARMMAEKDCHGSVNANGIVEIFERLHEKGYKGDELFAKASEIIAALSHSGAEKIDDIEAMFIDRMITKTFVSHNYVVKVAVYYYVFGLKKESIAQYIAKLVNYDMTIKQCRDRVNWCLDFFKEKLNASIEYELNNNNLNQSVDIKVMA